MFSTALDNLLRWFKASLTFQCSTEGNDTWHIAGDVGTVHIVETWRRLEH
jgi:hypothetical protein